MLTITEPEMFAKRIQRFMRWTRGIFLIVGTLMLSYVAITLLQARFYQEAANSTLDRQMHSEELRSGYPSRTVVKDGDVLGRIEIPRLGMSVAVLEGATSQTLRLGVGHIEGTALPGELGNIGIAGHRDTYFRDLKDIRASDEIHIQAASGLTRYEVDWIQITAPSDGGIVAPTTGSSLTLVTCYPFHFIGAAPERYVVHARKQ